MIKWAKVDKYSMWVITAVYHCTGVCEAGYTTADCNQCDTGYYGDGATCTTCGTHKTTPPSGTAATASECKSTLLSASANYILIGCV